MASWHVTRLNTIMGSLFARLCNIMYLSMQDHIITRLTAAYTFGMYTFLNEVHIWFVSWSSIQAHRVVASPKSAAGSEELSPDSPE